MYNRMVKKCSKCGVEKALNMFQWRKDHGALRADCKACVKIRADKYRAENLSAHNARSRAWAKANPEKARASVVAWNKANPERLRAMARKWQRENPETARKYRQAHKAEIAAKTKCWVVANRAKAHAFSKAWADANPEKQKARSRRWYTANPEKSTEKTQWRRAQKLRATPAWANKFFIEEAYDLAARRTAIKCGGYAKWHVDHIVPLKSKIVCGLHVERNLQVIPAVQNMAKSNRYWPDMPAGV